MFEIFCLDNTNIVFMLILYCKVILSIADVIANDGS